MDAYGNIVGITKRQTSIGQPSTAVVISTHRLLLAARKALGLFQDIQVHVVSHVAFRSAL